MLTVCPECELQVSDKAFNCPHCGYPMTSTAPRKSPKSKKHYRLPNGFGQITELKNRNLRNPFRVMVTVGKNQYGKPISKLLKPQAYYATYNEAYEALVKYHQNPYDVDEYITFEDLYKRWSESYFKEVTESSARTVRAAWRYCEELYNMPVTQIRTRHLRQCLENSSASANTKSRMKSVFNLLMDYAMEYDLADKNYARLFNLSEDIIKEQEKEYRGHRIYSEDELEILWNYSSVPYVNVILYQCYSGWRPQELVSLKLKDVDLKNGLVVGGMKTEAGKNRVVPIHSKVKNIIQKMYDEAVSVGSENLINCTDGSIMTYDKYQKRFMKVVEELKLDPNHRPHDGRKQFITACKNANVDEYAIKRLVGHAINDITESIYTDRDTKWLQTEIEKI